MFEDKGRGPSWRNRVDPDFIARREKRKVRVIGGISHDRSRIAGKERHFEVFTLRSRELLAAVA